MEKLFNLIEWIGYAASILIALSLLMTSLLKLRWINFFGCLLFAVYGFSIGALPVAIINSFIAVVNVYYLLKMYGQEEKFKILELEQNDQYLKEFTNFYAEGIKKHFPDFIKQEWDLGFYVLRNLVIAGIFLAKKVEKDTLLVKLDFVTPQYRDFKVGEYIFLENKDYWSKLGYRYIKAYSAEEKHIKYLKRMGFVEKEKGFLVKEV